MPLTTFQVGARLRRARLAADLTEQTAAARAGMDTARLWRLEEGRAYPTLPTLTRLAPVLGVSIDHLAGLAPALQQTPADPPAAGPAAVAEPVQRPHIVVDPAVNSGRPTLAGRRLPVAAVIDAYLSSEHTADVYNKFAIGRAELLTCCWWVARYAKQKKAWKQWLNAWEPALAAAPAAYDEVPLPPRSRVPAPARTRAARG